MRILLLIILIFVSFGILAQEFVECDGRNYWVKENEFGYCYVDLTGYKIIESDEPSLISVDDELKLLQFILSPRMKYENFGDDTLSILAEYAYYETQYFSYIYGENLEMQVERISGLKSQCILCYFEIPQRETVEQSDDLAKIQLFVVVICHENILALSSTQFVKFDFEEMKDMLINIIKTYDGSDEEFDPDEFCK